MNNIEYSDGDNIQFWETEFIGGEIERVGMIHFGIYADHEQYVDNEHLGFYVIYPVEMDGWIDYHIATLPDIVSNCRYKLIK